MMSDRVRESIRVALQQLHDERARIEGAIGNLEGFLENLLDRATSELELADDLPPPPRARRDGVGRQRSRAGWTPEARGAAAERMRRYWAQRRGAAAPATATATAATLGHSAPPPTSNDDGDGETAAQRRGWSKEARQAARERMLRYWEGKKSEPAFHG